MYLSLAWRNIWRNKKRSIISISAILFAVVIALFMRSMQLGTYENSINNAVSFFTGYIQIQKEEFWDKRSIDLSFVLTDRLKEDVESVEGVNFTTPRLESFALVSGDDHTKGAQVIGIDPESENRLTELSEKISEGAYLSQTDKGILIAEGIAKHLGVTSGDTIIVLGQGFHGAISAGKFSIKGIVKFPTIDLNNLMIYLTLEEARKLVGIEEERITSLVVMLKHQNYLNPALSTLKKTLDSGIKVLSWEDMMPELVQMIQTDNASGIIFLYMLYIVVGFGILGTVLMMTLERQREFGMLMAVGMKRGFIQIVVFIESIILCLTGVMSGIILGYPLVLYFYFHPIPLTGELAESTIFYGFEPFLPFSLDPQIFMNQTISVLVIAFVASLYPIWKISRLEILDAMRNPG